MRPPLLRLAAGLALLASTLSFAASPLVNFTATGTTYSGPFLSARPINTANSTRLLWNFDATTTPLFDTYVPVYGGVSVSGTGLGTTPSLRILNNSNAWPNKAAMFLNSTASATTPNSVDIVYLWDRLDFTNANGDRVVFGSDATLSVNVTDWAGTTGTPASIRFIVRNGDNYYVSQHSRSTAGQLTLTDFSGNSATGKLWAPVTLNGTSFSIPSNLTYGPVTFDDVRAVGWIGRASHTYTKLLACDSFQATGSVADNSMKISTNLGGVSYYNRNDPFVDIMKVASSWRTRNYDNVGGRNLDQTFLSRFMSLDADGWPTKLPFEQPYGNGVQSPDKPDDPTFLISTRQYAFTITQTMTGGLYTLRFKGTGRFKLSYPGPTGNVSKEFTPSTISALPTEDGYRVFTFSQALKIGTRFSTINLEFFETDIGTDSQNPQHLRDFSLLPPGITPAVAASSPFNPAYLAEQSGLPTLRFMDWGNTNDSTVSTWGQRVRPTRYTQGSSGVALEYMIAYANQAGANLWVCIPEQADDDYVTKAALVLLNGAKADGSPYYPETEPLTVRRWAGLNPSLKLIVEYSNETWNGEFSSNAYTQTKAAELRSQGFPFATNAGQAGHQYTSYRSAQIWALFYNVFGSASPDRLVRAIASQSANPWVSGQRLAAFKNSGLVSNGQYPDALAIAPYFGNGVGQAIGDSGRIDTITVPEILDMARTHMLAVLTKVAENRAYADQYGVDFICYEGGQHFIPGNKYSGNTTLVNKLTEANRDSGMGAIYAEYLTSLNAGGVSDFVHYIDISKYSASGFWGASEYLGQPIATAPKRAALLDFASTHLKTNVRPRVEVSMPPHITDTNGNGSESVTLSAAGSRDYDGKITQIIWRVNGQRVSGASATFTLPVGSTPVEISIRDDAGGVTTETFPVTVYAQGL